MSAAPPVIAKRTKAWLRLKTYARKPGLFWQAG